MALTNEGAPAFPAPENEREAALFSHFGAVIATDLRRVYRVPELLGTVVQTLAHYCGAHAELPHVGHAVCLSAMPFLDACVLLYRMLDRVSPSPALFVRDTGRRVLFGFCVPFPAGGCRFSSLPVAAKALGLDLRMLSAAETLARGAGCALQTGCGKDGCAEFAFSMPRFYSGVTAVRTVPVRQTDEAKALIALLLAAGM